MSRRGPDVDDLAARASAPGDSLATKPPVGGSATASTGAAPEHGSRVAVERARGPLNLHGSLTRRKLLIAVALILLALVALYFFLPKLAGLNQTWGRLQHGDPLWLGVAAGAELLSIVSYGLLCRHIFW